MSAPKNIQRDGIFLTLDESAGIIPALQSLLTANTATANAAAAVNVEYGEMQIANTAVSISAANQKVAGLYIDQPSKDRQPYRVKASLNIIGIDNNVTDAAIVVGYAPASITGSNDTIDEPNYIPFEHNFDDLIVVAAPTVSYEDRALFVGIAIQSKGGITTEQIRGHLSVQNLGTKPPTMQNAVS